MSAMQGDPGAARVVLKCGVPVIMVLLGTTPTLLATPAVLQRLFMYTVSGRQASAGCGI